MPFRAQTFEKSYLWRVVRDSDAGVWEAADKQNPAHRTKHGCGVKDAFHKRLAIQKAAILFLWQIQIFNTIRYDCDHPDRWSLRGKQYILHAMVIIASGFCALFLFYCFVYLPPRYPPSSPSPQQKKSFTDNRFQLFTLLHNQTRSVFLRWQKNKTSVPALYVSTALSFQFCFSLSLTIPSYYRLLLQLQWGLMGEVRGFTHQKRLGMFAIVQVCVFLPGSMQSKSERFFVVLKVLCDVTGCYLKTKEGKVGRWGKKERDSRKEDKPVGWRGEEREREMGRRQDSKNSWNIHIFHQKSHSWVADICSYLYTACVSLLLTEVSLLVRRGSIQC